MQPKNREHSDEENTPFEASESVLESIKPGVTYGDEHGSHSKPDQGPDAADHHRFPRRERKEIPQESLAARIRKATKGG